MTRRTLKIALISAAILTAAAAALIWWYVHKSHAPQSTTHTSPSHAEDRVYHLGSRGGVYYLSPGGHRVYIDRERGLELYNQQQKEIPHEIHDNAPQRNTDGR